MEELKTIHWVLIDEDRSSYSLDLTYKAIVPGGVIIRVESFKTNYEEDEQISHSMVFIPNVR